MLSTGKAVDKPSPMFNNPSFIDARRESETPNNEDTCKLQQPIKH